MNDRGQRESVKMEQKIGVHSSASRELLQEVDMDSCYRGDQTGSTHIERKASEKAWADKGAAQTLKGHRKNLSVEQKCSMAFIGTTEESMLSPERIDQGRFSPWWGRPPVPTDRQKQEEVSKAVDHRGSGDFRAQRSEGLNCSPVRDTQVVISACYSAEAAEYVDKISSSLR